MTHKLPPLSAIRAFEAAARHGSFTRAAAELDMTQAAISYQIKVLENRLRTPLFARKSGKVFLTPVGERRRAGIRGGRQWIGVSRTGRT